MNDDHDHEELIHVYTYRVSLIEQALLDCPSSKLIVSGYSQGAQLVHNAVALLSTASAEAISAVVMFGDPGK